LELHRQVETGKPTFGKLSVDGVYECVTLEDQVREPFVKIAGETAIPAGTYQVIVNMSNRFKRMLPLLLNVPQFEGVRIHPGNTTADTEGCILVGTHKEADRITNSRIAFDALFAKISSEFQNNHKIEIEILNEVA
jgi:hypothetical protein